MTDSLFWDKAPDFSAKEASELAVNYGLKITEVDHLLSNAVYERMEQSYNEKKWWYQKTDEARTYSDEFDSIPPEFMLESTVMVRVANQGESEDDEIFLSWLRNVNWPDFESQRFSRRELSRWFSAIGMKPRYSFETGMDTVTIGMEQSFSAKERLSLLKMVIGMAIKGYGYDPKAKKNAATSEIADDVAALKMSIDDDTVRRYLKEAVEKVKPAKPLES